MHELAFSFIFNFSSRKHVADDDIDREINGVPGVEAILRRRDLPSPCRSKEIDVPILQFFVNETLAVTRVIARSTIENMVRALMELI